MARSLRKGVHSFSLTASILAFVSFESLVAAQAFLAYHDHLLTVAQMQQQGIAQGLPFSWHFGMWSDFLLISPLAAYLIGRFFAFWQWHWISTSLTLGFLSAAILSWTYTFSNTPQAHVQNHALTTVGMVHLFYMAYALATFIQFLFFTPGVAARQFRAVSVLLFAHVVAGTHMVLGLLTVVHPLHWYPDQPLKSIDGWVTVAVVGLGLLWRSFARHRNV